MDLFAANQRPGNSTDLFSIGAMSKRPSIPAKLRRLVEIEAGHRCAIPRCLEHPIEIHHIVPYNKCKKHSFDNLIGLCAQCHARHHRTNEIDLQALKMYKSNLKLLNSRYSHFEKRVLEWFADNPDQREITLYGRELDVLYLVKDNILQKRMEILPMLLIFPHHFIFLQKREKV